VSARAGARAAAALALAAALAGGPGPAAADALVERVSRSDGIGGVGGFEITGAVVTSGAAQRDESRLRFRGGFLSAIQKMAGAGDGVTITRLDRDLVWTLDPEKKTYTETALTARGEQERRAPTSGPPARKAEPAEVVVTRNELKVEATGARQAFHGFPCEEYRVTWLLETRNRRTGETAKSTMRNRLWTTPETPVIRAVQAEEQAYARAYLAKLRLTAPPAEVRNAGLAALAGALGLDEAEQQRLGAQFRAEMAKIRGYAIVSELAWHMEGSGAEGAGRGGEAPPADLGSALGRLLGGGGSRGSAGGAAGEGPAPLFTFTTEVRSLRIVPPDPARYEVPADYARK
jgi:hypothetical protein